MNNKDLILKNNIQDIIRCKNCIHKPSIVKSKHIMDIIDFPDWKCPMRCEDSYYSNIPEDDWFCANGESKDN